MRISCGGEDKCGALRVCRGWNATVAPVAAYVIWPIGVLCDFVQITVTCGECRMAVCRVDLSADTGSRRDVILSQSRHYS